jgi:poly[(R)-3-hydroxyalkanoate] polymerase subunit PhaC
MAVSVSPAELVTRVQKDVERNLLRARNGVKYMAGVDRPQVGQTPKETVWRRDKAELWRYRSDRRTMKPPVLMVHSLVSRSYVLDLSPENSFVKRFLDEGFDVFLVDWGVPDERESANTLETYTHEYIPQCVDAVLDVTGSDEISLLGYCFGGVLSLLYLSGHPDAPVRNLITMATPVDSTKMGMMASIFRGDRLDPETLIDESGNVSAEVIHSGFRILKPTSDLSSYATLWQNLWNDEFMDGYQAMGQWMKDHIPFPGAAFRQYSRDFVRGNGIVEGTAEIAGDKVDLSRITCPLLSVVAEQDHIVPVDAAAPVVQLAGSTDAAELRIKAGHVGFVAGRQASKVNIPAILDWLRQHSEEPASTAA